jgi:hypothetical protein
MSWTPGMEMFTNISHILIALNSSMNILIYSFKVINQEMLNQHCNLLHIHCTVQYCTSQHLVFRQYAMIFMLFSLNKNLRTLPCISFAKYGDLYISTVIHCSIDVSRVSLTRIWNVFTKFDSLIAPWYCILFVMKYFII